MEAPPIVDHANALVSYHLNVIAGPIYHLRSLTIHNLDAGQENRCAGCSALAQATPSTRLAISSLYTKLRTDSTLNGYTFSFSPVKDKTTRASSTCPLSTRDTDQPTVTVH